MLMIGSHVKHYNIGMCMNIINLRGKKELACCFNQPPAGLEPAIPGLGGRCLIHWATEAMYPSALCPINTKNQAV